MKLYHYIHCPFCIRVRMGLRILNLNYESIPLRYDDEKTPIDLTGIKMLPIIQKEGQTPQNESLDILKDLDKTNIFKWEHLKEFESEINILLNKIGNHVHNLAMPYWVWTPEFDEASRKYFEDKKSVKRGPFKELRKNKDKEIPKLNDVLINELLPNLNSGFYKNSNLTIIDIMIASHLWGMYCVCEYQFPAEIHKYLQKVGQLTRFRYHEDFEK